MVLILVETFKRWSKSDQIFHSALLGEHSYEMISVDLTTSILPNESTHHGTVPYLHLRAYEDCTDVTHSSIHNSQLVAEYIGDFVSRC